MEETSNENLENKKETKTIGIHYAIILEKTLVNLINQ
jgi:hypothetical protein